jgi:hypothetical protein
VDTAAVIVSDHDPAAFWDNLGYTYSDAATDWIQFTGTGQINAGTGLTKSGNTINVGSGNGITLGADSVSVNADNGISVGASGVAVDIHTATDGTAIVLADTDEVLVGDASDTWAVKRVDMTQIQDYISSAGLDSDLVDGNGIADFTYNGSAGATVALDITNATDGTSLTLANTDEFLFADASDSNAVKKTTLAKIQDAVAAENADLTDGNGIADFTYDGGAAASVTVQTVSTDRITVAAGGIDVAGVPSTFKIAGSSVSANVTQTNVDLLVDGTAAAATFQDATALHGHNCIWDTINAGAAGITLRKGVRMLGNDTAVDGSANGEANANFIGIALDTASVGNPSRIVFSGVAPGVLNGSGVANTAYFFDDTGALTTTIPSGSARFLRRAGYGMNTNDLMLQIADKGRRAA